MKKLIQLLLILLLSEISFGQQVEKFVFNWDVIKNDSKVPQMEASWLHDSLSNQELTEVTDLVSSLSKPAAAQLVVPYFYLDGSFERASIKPYIDSFSIRPPDGEAGIIRVAYLCARLHKKLWAIKRSNKLSVAEFENTVFSFPAAADEKVNEHIDLSFDYEPASILLSILSKPDISYADILKKLDKRQFKALYQHRNQGFYTVPLNTERLAMCLERASSTRPLDRLYRYINPDGLLSYSDVAANLTEYKDLVKTLAANEKRIFHYINSVISPYLPENTAFKRKVSFFLINNADGWASDDITGIDLNFYKDNYERLIRLLCHETFHSGQNAVGVADTVKRNEAQQSLVGILNSLFGEGTASLVAPASIKTKEEYDKAVAEGVTLLEDAYRNTVSNYNSSKAQELLNKGVAGGGPFYWLGAEMSKVIVEVFGKKKLASVIPYNGIVFFKTYFSAVAQSGSYKNLFSEEVAGYIHSMQ